MHAVRARPTALGGVRPYDGCVLRAVLYWTAVVAISLAFVVVLILFFESRDQAGVEGGVITFPLALPPS